MPSPNTPERPDAPASVKKPSRLGRGLSSLMTQPVAVTPTETEALAAASPPESATVASVADVPRETPPNPDGAVMHVEVGQIEPNPHQPRQAFSESALKGLAESIKQDGLMQPVLVRPNGQEGRYTLVAGERRWRAAKLAGLASIPALVRDVDDQQSAELALIENLQREDLNPIERAEAFHGLAETFGLSHDRIAERVGLDRSTVTNLLRLLKLAEPCRELVREGLISMGQARAIAGLNRQESQVGLAHQAVRENLSVRQVEQRVRDLNAPARNDKPLGTKAGRPAYLEELERRLAEQLGSKVQIKPGKKKGTGSLTIEFYSLDQFDALCDKLGIQASE